jgi:hypothetical protein
MSLLVISAELRLGSTGTFSHYDMRRRFEACTTTNTLLVLSGAEKDRGVRRDGLHWGLTVSPATWLLLLTDRLELRTCDWSRDIRVAFLFRRGVNG